MTTLEEELEKLSPYFLENELLADSFGEVEHAFVVARNLNIDIERLFRALQSIHRDLASLVDNEDLDPVVKEGMMVGIKTSLEKITEKINRQVKDKAVDALAAATYDSEEDEKRIKDLFNSKKYAEVLWELGTASSQGAEENLETRADGLRIFVEAMKDRVPMLQNLVGELGTVVKEGDSDKLNELWERAGELIMKAASDEVMLGAGIDPDSEEFWNAVASDMVKSKVQEAISGIIEEVKALDKEAAMEMEYALKDGESEGVAVDGIARTIAGALADAHRKRIDAMRPMLASQYYGFSEDDWVGILKKCLKDLTLYDEYSETLTDRENRWKEFLLRLRRFYEAYARSKAMGTESQFSNVIEEVRESPAVLFGPLWDKLGSMEEVITETEQKIDDLITLIEMADQIAVKFDIPDLEDDEKKLVSRVIELKMAADGGSLSYSEELMSEVEDLVSRISRAYNNRVEVCRRRAREVEEALGTDGLDEETMALRERVHSDEKMNLSTYEMYLKALTERVSETSKKEDRDKKAGIKEAIDDLIVEYSRLAEQYDIGFLADEIYNLDEDTATADDVEAMRRKVENAVAEARSREDDVSSQEGPIAEGEPTTDVSPSGPAEDHIMGMEDGTVIWHDEDQVGDEPEMGDDEEIDAVFDMDDVESPSNVQEAPPVEISEAEVENTAVEEHVAGEETAHVEELPPEPEVKAEVPTPEVEGTSGPVECSLCHLKMPSPEYFCPYCGSPYHGKCARQVGFCPICGKDLHFPTDEEEDRGDSGEKMFCPYCGTELPVGSETCTNCGAVLPKMN